MRLAMSTQPLKGMHGTLSSYARSVLFGLLLTSAEIGHCGQTREIELTDGSIVVGEILAADPGAYTVKSRRLGVIQLKDTDIVNIRATGSEPRPPAPTGHVPSPSAEGIASLQNKILNSPRLLQSVKALAGEPDVQALLRDPELMRAILGGNLEALQNNPKLQKLMTNPNVQDLSRQLRQ